MAGYIQTSNLPITDYKRKTSVTELYGCCRHVRQLLEAECSQRVSYAQSTGGGSFQVHSSRYVGGPNSQISLEDAEYLCEDHPRKEYRFLL